MESTRELKRLQADTKHSLDRAKERAGWNEKRAKKMMNLARQRGIRSDACRWMADKRYLEEKCDEQAEAIAYSGYCFILERDTKYCITVFPLPKEFGLKKTKYRKPERRENQRLRSAICWL